MSNTTLNLKEQYSALKAENPKLRIRNAAKQLAISEADLVAINEANIALKPDFEKYFKRDSFFGLCHGTNA